LVSQTAGYTFGTLHERAKGNLFLQGALNVEVDMNILRMPLDMPLENLEKCFSVGYGTCNLVTASQFFQHNVASGSIGIGGQNRAQKVTRGLGTGQIPF
jgi:hypothetical protein